MTSPDTHPQRNSRGLTRFPIRSKVKITFPKTGNTLQGECRNISATGLLICAEKKIPINTEINVEIQEGRIDFNALVRVVRSTLSDGDAMLGLAVV